MRYRLQVLIPAALDARVSKAAQRRRLSKDDWVRHAIERFLADEGDSEDALDKLCSLDAPTADIEQMLAEIDRRRHCARARQRARPRCDRLTPES